MSDEDAKFRWRDPLGMAFCVGWFAGIYFLLGWEAYVGSVFGGAGVLYTIGISTGYWVGGRYDPYVRKLIGYLKLRGLPDN